MLAAVFDLCPMLGAAGAAGARCSDSGVCVLARTHSLVHTALMISARRWAALAQRARAAARCCSQQAGTVRPPQPAAPAPHSSRNGAQLMTLPPFPLPAARTTHPITEHHHMGWGRAAVNYVNSHEAHSTPLAHPSQQPPPPPDAPRSHHAHTPLPRIQRAARAAPARGAGPAAHAA